jgi:hypothetical protein
MAATREQSLSIRKKSLAAGKGERKMGKARLKWIALCGLFVLGAAAAVPITHANPPFASATYTGTTSQGLEIVLIVNEAGNGLADGSYVDFQCGTNPPARQYLGGTSIHIPSGVTNRSGTSPGFEGGTLSWRFFSRFFTQAGAPPGGGQTTFPTGPPPPGTPPPMFTQPPGEKATGDFSGRNNTGIPGGVGFCSFRATWNVVMVPAG